MAQVDSKVEERKAAEEALRQGRQRRLDDVAEAEVKRDAAKRGVHKIKEYVPFPLRAGIFATRVQALRLGHRPHNDRP